MTINEGFPGGTDYEDELHVDLELTEAGLDIAAAPAFVPDQQPRGLSRPAWVFLDANSHDPDAQVPVPDHKFTDI
jgi:hypothetical protein